MWDTVGRGGTELQSCFLSLLKVKLVHSVVVVVAARWLAWLDSDLAIWVRILPRCEVVWQRTIKFIFKEASFWFPAKVLNNNVAVSGPKSRWMTFALFRFFPQPKNLRWFEISKSDLVRLQEPILQRNFQSKFTLPWNSSIIIGWLKLRDCSQTIRRLSF